MDFAERDKCKPVLLRLSLDGKLENHLCPSMGPNGRSVAMDSVCQPMETLGWGDLTWWESNCVWVRVYSLESIHKIGITNTRPVLYLSSILVDSD
jgi:hypothetical protein